MSFSLYIKGARPTCAEVNAFCAEKYADFSWDYLPEADAWPDDEYGHAFRWGVSTRTVELGMSEDSFQVRIMSCSCPEDFELALAIVEFVANQYDAEIESEYGNTCSAAELHSEFDQDWIDEMADRGATILPRMLESGDVAGPLTIPGPRKNFVFGERVQAEVGPVDDGYADRLFDKIREVRYFDPDEIYFHANVMQIENDGERTLFSVWGPGVDYVFPDVSNLVIVDDRHIMIATEDIERLPHVNFRFLDDQQLVVDAVPEANWPEVVEAARGIGTEL